MNVDDSLSEAIGTRGANCPAAAGPKPEDGPEAFCLDAEPGREAAAEPGREADPGRDAEAEPGRDTAGVEFLLLEGEE